MINKDTESGYTRYTIRFPYKIAGKLLFHLSFEGIRRNANIFKNTPLTSLSPLKEEMKKEGVDVAFLYSYPLARRFPKISFHERYICYVKKHYKHFFINTNENFEQYLSRFKGKTISTLRRKIKKVSSTCKNEAYFQIFSTSAEIENFYAIAKEISLKSFQHRLYGKGLPMSEDFLMNIKKEAAKGLILGFILFIDDKPVSYTLCPVYDEGVMMYHYTGYDPDYEKYSPGTVLQFKIIEAAFENDKINYYDFCTGDGKHKEFFTDDYKLCGYIYFFPVKLRYLFIVSIRFFLDKVIDIYKFLSDLFGTKNKLTIHIRRNV